MTIPLSPPWLFIDCGWKLELLTMTNCVLNFGWVLSHLSTLFAMLVQQTDVMNGAGLVRTLCASCRLLKSRKHIHTLWHQHLKHIKIA